MIGGCCLGFGFFPLSLLFASITELPPQAGKLTPKLKSAVAVKLLPLKAFGPNPFCQTHPLSGSHFPMLHLDVIYKHLHHTLHFLCLVPKPEPCQSPSLKLHVNLSVLAKPTAHKYHSTLSSHKMLKFNSSHPRIPNPSPSTPNKSINMHYYYMLRYYIRFLLMPKFQLAVPWSIYTCVLYLTTAHSKCSQLLGMKCT